MTDSKIMLCICLVFLLGCVSEKHGKKTHDHMHYSSALSEAEQYVKWLKEAEEAIVNGRDYPPSEKDTLLVRTLISQQTNEPIVEIRQCTSDKILVRTEIPNSSKKMNLRSIWLRKDGENWQVFLKSN